MLEYQHYIIDPKRSWFGNTTCQICDAEAGSPVGTIEETVGWASRILRYGLSRKLARSQFDVRETLDESLVFSIVKPRGLFASRYEVIDSQEELVGTIGHRGFWYVRDEHGTTIARSDGSIAQGSYRIITNEGDIPLAEVKRNGPLPKPLQAMPGQFSILMDDDFDESPFAKMLILGIIFLIELATPTPKRKR